MLFDFYAKQNAKKPGSVHATYLLDGTPKPVTSFFQINRNQRNGDDVHMQSSPFMSSAAQEEDKEEELAVPSRNVILAREEDLDRAKSSLKTVHSIHIYSLQPNTLQNLQALSDCSRTISTTFNKEDPLMVGQQYGVINNTGVRRRVARRPSGFALSVAAAKGADKTTPKPMPGVPEDAKAGSKTAKLSSQESSVKAEEVLVGRLPSKSSSKPTALRQEQSNIFRSFSKPKSIFKEETTDNSTAESLTSISQESAREQEDNLRRDDSDDEQEKYISENRADPKARSTRSQRMEQLRKMMDDDDEEMEDTDKGANIDAQQDLAAIEPLAQREPTTKPAPVGSGGRRRGRRKVMKKKTIRDEEDYLVTKEEPAWESFSEDEPDAQNERVPFSSAASSKGKKTGGAKPGQGNIMSFFGKK